MRGSPDAQLDNHHAYLGGALRDADPRGSVDLRDGPAAALVAGPLGAVGALIVFRRDLEQILAQQGAFHSLRGVPDEPRSLSVLLGRYRKHVGIIGHIPNNTGLDG